MELHIYKGFDSDFLSKIQISHLTGASVEEAKNVLKFTPAFRKNLDKALLAMDEEDERWITYEEYTLVKSSVDNAIENYGLNVVICRNNFYSGYYPLEFSMSDSEATEIFQNMSKENAEQSEICQLFFAVYSSLTEVEGRLFASYYNFEIDSESKISVDEYYPSHPPLEGECDVEMHICVDDDAESYLKNLLLLQNKMPHSVGVSIISGLVAERNLRSLSAWCASNDVKLVWSSEPVEESQQVSENDLIDIAKNDLGISSFLSFRQLQFYKNPDLCNELWNVSQSKIISDIITQAEKAYSTEHNFRDIFITASTGAGKSLIFQIAAVYLAKKYHKLTIIIDPTKSLMKDQKDQLNANGYMRVEVFNSDVINQTEKEAILERVKNGSVDLLYLSPETLLSYSISTIVGDREIGLVIVDEAHIVTTWGEGFRPDYWYLGGYINKIRSQSSHSKKTNTMYFPICAFTATAINGGVDDSVGETIISLCMENPIKYIGYVKRSNIKFDITVRETEKLDSKEYENRKAQNLADGINKWVKNDEKTIVYFPFATFADDARQGGGSFAGKQFPRDKVAIYTGRNISATNAEEHANQKKIAFEDFRSGKKPVMFATKAFGMGVNISDITNVYHYAVTGNFCDYIQEIGRAARDPSSVGHAITDYYSKDVSFMRRLFEMSQIRRYQINLVLSGIYDTYKSKKGKRNFLISPEAFTYIFTGKKADDSSDKQINKLKTCLMMLEKDLYDKYGFKVLISRPGGVFTKAYVCVDRQYEKQVLFSKYGKYFNRVEAGRVRENQGDSVVVSDMGDIFSLDLKGVWEEYYPNISFPQFKYFYFNSRSMNKNNVVIMPEISDKFSQRRKIRLETKDKNDRLCDVYKKMLGDMEYIGQLLSESFKGRYFQPDELISAISPKYGSSQARIIVNSLFRLVDPANRCVKSRAAGEHGGTSYYIANGTLKAMMSRAVTGSAFVRNLAGNTEYIVSRYIPVSNSNDEIALKLLTVFDYVTYEVSGGEEPEIFIRLNDPEKIRRIISGEIKYRNGYIKRARERNDREVQIFRKFFTTPLTDDERWDFVERYFLGMDVIDKDDKIEEDEITAEEE